MKDWWNLSTTDAVSPVQEKCVGWGGHLGKPAGCCGLWKHRNAPLQVPAQDNLPGGPTQLLGDFHDLRPLSEAGGSRDLAAQGTAETGCSRHLIKCHTCTERLRRQVVPL